jgi:hypothetical protein
LSIAVPILLGCRPDVWNRGDLEEILVVYSELCSVNGTTGGRKEGREGGRKERREGGVKSISVVMFSTKDKRKGSKGSVVEKCRRSRLWPEGERERERGGGGGEHP